MQPKNACLKYVICGDKIQKQWDKPPHQKTTQNRIFIKEKEFSKKKNLLRYASVDKYVLLHEGLTSLHFKEKCSCIAAPNELYSVQYPVDK